MGKKGREASYINRGREKKGKGASEKEGKKKITSQLKKRREPREISSREEGGGGGRAGHFCICW